MIIFPAIDLYDKKAVRLYKGDYNQMTIYSDNPVMIADDFLKKGATHVHLVDLAGAKDGTTPNFETVCKIKKQQNTITFFPFSLLLKKAKKKKSLTDFTESILQETAEQAETDWDLI